MIADPVSPSASQTNFLRSWRNSRKLTLEQLAEQTGIKVSTLSGWETGRRNVVVPDLVKLAEAYGVHPAALLFAPDNATEKVRKMQTASTLAEQMDSAAADEWLAMGKRLVGGTR